MACRFASTLLINAAAVLLAGATSAAAAPTTVRIGVPERDNLQYLTLWVAIGAGYFDAEGLAVQLVVPDAPNRAGQLLLSKQVDVALLQPPVYLGLIAQRQPIVLFANLLANDPINLVVRADVAARLKLDPGAPLIDRLKALKGLRIGLNNEPPRRLRVLLSLAGMDADHDIDMRLIQAEDQIAAFESGAVDALYTHTPYLEDAIVAHNAVLFVNQSAGEAAPLSRGEIHSLASTRQFAAEHPDVLAAVTRAIARAERLLHTDADAAVRALATAGIREPSDHHLSTIVAIYRNAVPATPRVSAESIERDVELYPSRPSPPDFGTIHVVDFVGPEFADPATRVFDLGVVNVTAPSPALSPVVGTLDHVAIENLDARTVDRAIEYLPGVSIDHKAPRNQAGISIGGFDMRQVPLYLDGIPAYVPFDGFVDLGRYLTSDVGEVQVAKGYTSPLLGPNVLGGVINLVSRQPLKSIEGDAFAGTGAGGLMNAGVHAGSLQRTYFLQASADRLQSDFYPVSGRFASNAGQPGLHRVNSAQRDSRYRLRAGWTPRAADSYVLSYSNQVGSTGVPPYAGSAPPCSPGVTVTTPCVTPKFWKWPEWNTDSYYFNSSTALGATSTTQLRAFYVRYANTMEMLDNASYSTMNVGAASGRARNRDHTLGMSGEFDNHAVSRNAIGVSFFVKDDTHVEQTTTFSAANVPMTTPAQRDRDRQASFGVHDAFTLTPQVRATAGVSADRLNGLEAQDLNADRSGTVPFPTDRIWTFNPVASLSFASGRAGSVFVAFAQKSRFPTMKDRYSYKAGRALPNPTLDAERATTWTAGYSRAFGRGTVAQIDLFHSSVRDEIENIFFLSPLCPAAVPGSGSGSGAGSGSGGGGGAGRAPAGTCQQAVNVGREMHAGVAASVKTTPTPHVTLDANYSFLHRDVTGTPGVFPTGTPTHKAVAVATVLLPRRATAVVSLLRQAGIVAMSDNGLPLRAAAFTTMDAGGQMPVRAGLRLQAGIKNLFDRDYYYWEGFPEPGRTGYVTLRLAF